jgi:hypothetical protein
MIVMKRYTIKNSRVPGHAPERNFHSSFREQSLYSTIDFHILLLMLSVFNITICIGLFQDGSLKSKSNTIILILNAFSF